MTRCLQNTTAIVCYDFGGVKTQLIGHYVYDKDGVLYATVYTQADGTPVDTSPGIVTPGPCDCCDNLVGVVSESFCYRAIVDAPGQFAIGDVLHKQEITVVSTVTGLIDADTSMIYWVNDTTNTPLSQSNQAGVVSSGTVPNPSQYVPCAAYVEPVVSASITTFGANYASPTLAADYDPNGNGPTWTAPAGLQSFTVIVRKAGKKPADVNRVRVDTPTGKYFLIEGDVRTWSVAQDIAFNESLTGIPQVEAENDSAFDVVWTVQ